MSLFWKKRPAAEAGGAYMSLFWKRRPAEEVPRCSFCNRAQQDVKKLIAGPNVFICDRCVETCQEIIAGGGGGSGSVVFGPTKTTRLRRDG